MVVFIIFCMFGIMFFAFVVASSNRKTIFLTQSSIQSWMLFISAFISFQIFEFGWLSYLFSQSDVNRQPLEFFIGVTATNPSRTILLNLVEEAGRFGIILLFPRRLFWLAFIISTCLFVLGHGYQNNFPITVLLFANSIFFTLTGIRFGFLAAYLMHLLMNFVTLGVFFKLPSPWSSFSLFLPLSCLGISWLLICRHKKSILPLLRLTVTSFSFATSEDEDSNNTI